MIPIEKSIPIPAHHRHPSFREYPFNELEAGDSFFVPDRTTTQMGSYVSRFNTTNSPKRCISRKENNGVRIWRIL